MSWHCHIVFLTVNTTHPVTDTDLYALVCRQYKETALHYAAKCGQLSAAIYLVEQAEALINALNDVRLSHYTSIFYCSIVAYNVIMLQCYL